MPHVTFIHGHANKPALDVLTTLWRDGLARGDGLDLGAEAVTSTMVYRADVLYGEPQQELAEHESNDSIVEASDAEADMSWRDNLADAERDWVETLAGKMNFDAAPPSDDDSFGSPPFETTELRGKLQDTLDLQPSPAEFKPPWTSPIMDP